MFWYIPCTEVKKVVSARKHQSVYLFSDDSCKLNSGSLLSISGGRFSFLPAIRKPVWETRWVYILYTKTIFVCPRKLFLRGQLLRFRTLLTETWSFISFVHELYFIFSGNLKLDFLLFFCFAWYFFISSIATSVMYFSCIIRSPCINVFLIIYSPSPTFLPPQKPPNLC